MHHCLHKGEPAYLAESVRRTSSRNIRRHTRSNDKPKTSNQQIILPFVPNRTMTDRTAVADPEQVGSIYVNSRIHDSG